MLYKNQCPKSPNQIGIGPRFKINLCPSPNAREFLFHIRRAENNFDQISEELIYFTTLDLRIEWENKRGHYQWAISNVILPGVSIQKCNKVKIYISKYMLMISGYWWGWWYIRSVVKSGWIRSIVHWVSTLIVHWVSRPYSSYNGIYIIICVVCRSYYT